MEQHSDAVHITFDTFRQILADAYKDNPSLVPFNDGDRASQCGCTSASDFAKQKLHDYEVIQAYTVNIRKGSDSRREKYKRAAASRMSKAMHMEQGSNTNEAVLDIPGNRKN